LIFHFFEVSWFNLVEFYISDADLHLPLGVAVASGVLLINDFEFGHVLVIEGSLEDGGLVEGHCLGLGFFARTKSQYKLP
jgi:hypothetical protein